MREYTSVKIPKVFAIKIQEKAFPYGYRSVAEFVICATISRVVELEKNNAKM